MNKNNSLIEAAISGKAIAVEIVAMTAKAYTFAVVTFSGGRELVKLATSDMRAMDMANLAKKSAA